MLSVNINLTAISQYMPYILFLLHRENHALYGSDVTMFQKQRDTPQDSLVDWTRGGFYSDQREFSRYFA